MQPETAATTPLEVEWRVARDPEMADILVSGNERAEAEADFTVKVDVAGLDAGTTYYYDFRVGDERSPIGRTRTLPRDAAAHARIAVACCANYPAGYFNVYRRIAERTDLDLVLHLGDYVYEYANGSLGDGIALGRIPEPDREVVTLEEYRARHAQYKADADLRELHRQHPIIAVWDDHEVADDAFQSGAINHQPDSEGEWLLRKRNAQRAYFEWMPVRAAAPGDTERIYRTFAFGDLFDLVMLDTRFVGRAPRIVSNCDAAGIEDNSRSLLGPEQEQWLLDQLDASIGRGASWRLIGQQVMFAQLSNVELGCVLHPDQWDGYAPNRLRLLEAFEQRGLRDIVFLTGDAHSSWAAEIAKDPFSPERYVAETSAGSLAVEFVAPAVTSPGSGTATDEMLETHPHVKFAETTHRGYILLDVTHERIQAEWYFVDTVSAPSDVEELGAAFRVDGGHNRVLPALPTQPKVLPPRPAP